MQRLIVPSTRRRTLWTTLSTITVSRRVTTVGRRPLLLTPLPLLLFITSRPLPTLLVTWLVARVEGGRHHLQPPLQVVLPVPVARQVLGLVARVEGGSHHLPPVLVAQPRLRPLHRLYRPPRG